MAGENKAKKQDNKKTTNFRFAEVTRCSFTQRLTLELADRDLAIQMMLDGFRRCQYWAQGHLALEPVRTLAEIGLASSYDHGRCSCTTYRMLRPFSRPKVSIVSWTCAID
ncbi:hypothetical protein PoB_002419800 [Plakobranchus ocellatus]|uniref:Uncharacterized protein n=1 Tax=Plakobranchus ocellatus TaxID=259542 RepID=A0AAV3ZT82_9GAST|nr:hypothetical protein PoB_002419800 [Plakobranchus ocellatus]